jgi:hypothetical protein
MAYEGAPVSGKRSFTHGEPIVIDISDFPSDWLVKWCGACGKNKPIKEFYSNISKPNGLSSECRSCNNSHRVARRRNAAL